MNSLPLVPLPLPTGVDMQRRRLQPVTKIVEIRDPDTGITAKLAFSGGTWKLEATNNHKLAICSEFGFTKMKIIYNPGEEGTMARILHMDDLFAGLDQSDYLRCDMSPNTLLPTGHGSMILDYATQMAAEAGTKGVALINAAKFPDWRVPSPSVELNKLTPYLTLVRGFGFYEGRGFTSVKYPCGTPDAILPHLQRDLLWNHMIATTPLDKLESEIGTKGRDLMWKNETATVAWDFVLTSNLASLRMLLSDLPSSKLGNSMRYLFTQKSDPETAIKVGEWFESIWKRYDGTGAGPDGDEEDEIPNPSLIQRIFYIPLTASDALIPHRINIRSVENNNYAMPIVELVPIGTRIESRVLFEKQET